MATWPASRGLIPSSDGSRRARRAREPAERANVPAALRSPSASSVPGSPTPTNTSGGPSERGSTSACPAFPANPAASRADRSWPTSSGTAPAVATSTPTTSASGGGVGAVPIATCAIRPTPGAGSKSAGTATPPVLLDIVQQPSQRPQRVRSDTYAVAPDDRAY